MTVNFFTFRTLLCLFALSFGLVGCSSNVRLVSTGNPLLTKPVDLQAVASTYPKIRKKSASPDEVDHYNREVRSAAAQLVRQHRKSGDTFKTVDGEISFQIDGRSVRNFSRIDKLALAESIHPTQGVVETVELCGAGVPMLGRVSVDENDPHVPKQGYWVPLTAVLEPGRKCPTIRLIDTSCPDRDCHYPVAANFTAPLVRDFSDRQKEFNRGGALFNFDRFSPCMGMKRVFEFHPKKKPVIFVHGIFSSSTTWIQTLNQLMKDPEIRARYEFWTYEYPTGAPIPYLALHLREDLEEMLKFRKSQGATCSDVVVVGHSMGGLMAKALTQHSGDKQWYRFFDQAPESLDVSAEEQQLLREMFYFEPLPCVKRVVFTATPHSGADATNRSIVQLAGQFIQTPQILLGVTQNVLHQSAHALTPLGFEVHHDFPNSIEQMSYGSELGDIFSDIPLSHCVKYHSIMGSKHGLDVPKDEMTDGVVTYESAHIDGVESELIIHSDHGVQRSADGIAEIARILKLAK